MAFVGSTEDLDTFDSNSFGNWYERYLYRSGKEDDLPTLGSDEHFNLLVDKTHREWADLVIILGDKALPETFDILNIVRRNFKELFLTHPKSSDM